LQVNIINFTVTFDGLEDQLLADVVKNEQPHIEQQRDDNIVNLAGYKKKIIQCEKTILQMLNDSKPETLLDDVDLINTLESSKMTSEEIKIKIEESTKLEEVIEQTRNQYKSVSIRGSILFFVIKDLSIIDPMYQYSLQYVKGLFNKAMQSSPESADLQKRLTNLINQITRMIFTNVCRGLFEAHKLIFSFLIASSIDRQNLLISEAVWSTFLRGGGVIDRHEALPNPDPSVLNDITWEFAIYLQQNFPAFDNLAAHISKNWPLWQKYHGADDPINEKIPGEFQDKLDLFDRLMILKLFRPEKLLFGFSNFVEKKIGNFYLEIPTINMQEIYLSSDVKTPIIFVLSSGADPTQLVINFAKEKGVIDRLQSISLGQGQGVVASAMIDNARREGQWVLL
jgi:dynein heavy chain